MRGHLFRWALSALAVLAFGALVTASAGADARFGETCLPGTRGCAVAPVPSLEPAATEALWKRLVQHPRPVRTQGACRPLRAIFYAATDWLRLATRLAANASPCAEYYFSIPPMAGDKTVIRPDQAWRIRALGPNFHALAEIHWTTWSRWVSTTGSSWYDAGVEARWRMAEAGFDVGAGDTWAINEFPSAVRNGAGSARANARQLVRGLYEAGGMGPARGVVFIIGVGQRTSPVSVYQTLVQNWLADQAFWRDMSAYVSDWSQEVYGDFRHYAIPGAPITQRRDYLNYYLQHALVVARAGPATIEPARDYLQAAHSPLGNAAWQWETGYGWTMIPMEEMQAFVSAQVYAARAFSAAANQTPDRWGFAWQPSNETAIHASDFTRKTRAILDRLAAAIKDSDQTSDPEDPGSGACGPPGQNLYCGGEHSDARFTELWKSFRSWSEPVLTFSTPPQTITAGTVSTPITLTLATSSGAPQVAARPITITLTSSSPNGQFSLSPTGPWTNTLTDTIPAGSTSSPSFFYLDTQAGPLQLSGAAIGVTTAAQIETVQAGPPVNLHVEPDSIALEPRGSKSIETVAADVFGNPVSAQATWSVRPAGLGTIEPDTGPATMLSAGGRGGTGWLIATVAGTAGEILSGARLQVAPGPIRVSSIHYAPGTRALRVTATLTEVGGPPARGVRTSVAARRNGRWVFSGAGRTDANGRVTYVVPLKDGCYRTTMKEVTASGYRWDGKTPANRFCT